MKKKLLSTFISLFAVTLLFSCGNGELTTGAAEKALEKTDMFKDSSVYASIEVGYMQIDDESARLKYRKFEKAGVISYKMDIVIEERVYRGWGSTTVRRIPHYFVTAALTPEGEKFRIYNKVKSADEDDDVKSVEVAEMYPEDVEYASDIYVSEDQKNNNDYIVDEIYAEEEETDISNQSSSTPYEAAISKCHIVSYDMYAGRLALVKVRNIKENKINQTASAQAIIQIGNVSPFGRILLGLKNGVRETYNFDLERFVDKGWVVKGTSKN